MAGMQSSGKGTGFTLSRRISAAKAHEISTFEDFVEGYRSREDSSLLKPSTLVPGSHDVLVKRSGRVAKRQGYIMDGAKSTVASPIRPMPVWKTQTGVVHAMRAGFISSALNDGKIQIRYVDTLGALGAVNNVSWLDLLTGLTSTYAQSTNYWDTANVKAKLLIVNRTGSVWEWTGAIGTVLSVTPTSITLNGTKTLAQLGFDASGFIINNAIVYQYDSISGQTFTLHNGTPDPTGSVVNSPVYQQPVSSSFSGYTFTNSISPPTGFTVDLIAVLDTNQVMLASITNNLVYLSKAGNYKDYSQSTVRLQYEGNTYTTLGPVTSLIPQEGNMYISAGLNEWYVTVFNPQAIFNANTGTTITYDTTSKLSQLKTSALQASQSQYATTKIANDVIFLTNEPVLASLGRVDNITLTPQVTELSFPIADDMDKYDFTDASVFYFKKYLYLAVPKMGLIRIYNMTNPKKPFWEAPQNIGLSGFTAVGNSLIGHSYQTSESYVLNTGTSDRAADANSVGLPISANAVFAFNSLGLRAKRKSMNKFFVEGYMNSITSLNVGLTYRSPDPGILPSQTVNLSGTGSYVLQNQSLVSLGKSSLGKNPLGGDIQFPQQINLPSYFAVVATFTRKVYLDYQPSFSSNAVSEQWELLAFGSNASPSYEMEVDITN